MESTVWNKLSDDLQFLVFARLPLLDLRSLSLTCKYFQSLLSDPSFPIHYHRHRLAHPTFFVASRSLEKHKRKTVLNSAIWHGGRKFMFPWQSPLLNYLRGSSAWSMSSYGDGFVCFEGLLGPQEKLTLLVFNPLFPHESKFLSPPAAPEKLYTAIAFDRKNDVCKLVFWCTLPDKRVVTFVYNFQEGTWKTATGCNGIGRNFAIGGCAQLVNDRFLCWLCADFNSYVTMVLVFDVEEECWREPITVGNGSFMCTAQHEKQLCVINKTVLEEGMVFGVWKFNMEQRVWGLPEFIPPPISSETAGTDYNVRGGGSGFFWVTRWNGKKRRYDVWAYNMSHHSWLNLGPLGMGKFCFEGSLYRLVCSAGKNSLKLREPNDREFLKKSRK